MVTMGPSCKHVVNFRVHVFNTQDSSNDVLDFENEAAGTSFAAGSTAQAALETLYDGNRWMINRNIETQVRT